MINDVKAGDTIFVVRDYCVRNGNRYQGHASDFNIEIEEKNIFAIIDFGDCKKIAFDDDGDTVKDYLFEDETTTMFTNYGEALRYAKLLACKHFITDSTGRGAKND